MKKLFTYKYQIGIIALLLLFTFPVLMPYFRSGFFPTHDGEWTVVRLADMFRTIRDGQFPARYSGYLNFQYGYPLFNFAYPMPYYAGLFFVLAKFGFVTSIKLLFVGATISSVIGMYFFSQKVWKNSAAGFVSAILFLYFPYRMVDLYVRGSLGEIFAFGIIPWMFLTMLLTIEKKSLQFAGLTALLVGILIPSHNIMSLLFLPILAIYSVLLAYHSGKNSYIYPVISLVLGVGIAAFFWLPALAEKNLILLSTIPIADRSLYFVSFSQLVIPSWGYGVPTDVQNGFTYHLGIAQIIVLILSIGVLIHNFRNGEKRKIIHLLAGLLVAITGVCMFMMFEFSSFVWDSLPLLSEINYPWTLIAPIGFLLSFLAGYVAIQNKSMRVVGLLVALFGVVLVFPYARPQEFVDRGDDFYVTNSATTTSSQEYTPLWVKKLPLESPNQKIEVASGAAQIDDLNISSNKISFSARVANPAKIRVNTIYYPGWHVYINDVEVPVLYNNQEGVMELKVDKGMHRVQAVFSETPLRTAANGISIVTMVMTCILVLWSFIKRNDASA